MKVTTPPRWFDWTPQWEVREVREHYQSDGNELVTVYRKDTITVEEARERRRRGEPLEYILGHCHVGPITVKCDERALIPRPETETLLRRFVSRLDDLPPGPLVDCGTGTGIIAGWINERTDRRIFATDRFRPALSLAQENRNRHDRDYRLVQSDRLHGLQGPFAGVLSNLPYVFPNSQSVEDTVLQYEPKEALVVPEDPSEFYGSMIDQAKTLLKPGGEVWFEGSELLFDVLKTNGLLSGTPWEWRISRDEFGLPRFLVLRKLSPVE